MRDPRRIKPILESLELLWRRNPDYRFGQLIQNLFVDAGSNHVYYMEEDVLEELLAKALNLGGEMTVEDK